MPSFLCNVLFWAGFNIITIRLQDNLLSFKPLTHECHPPLCMTARPIDPAAGITAVKLCVLPEGIVGKSMLNFGFDQRYQRQIAFRADAQRPQIAIIQVQMMHDVAGLLQGGVGVNEYGALRWKRAPNPKRPCQDDAAIIPALHRQPSRLRFAANVRRQKTGEAQPFCQAPQGALGDKGNG